MPRSARAHRRRPAPRRVLRRRPRRGAHLERRTHGGPDRRRARTAAHLGHRPHRPLGHERRHRHVRRRLVAAAARTARRRTARPGSPAAPFSVVEQHAPGCRRSTARGWRDRRRDRPDCHVRSPTRTATPMTTTFFGREDPARRRRTSRSSRFPTRSTTSTTGANLQLHGADELDRRLRQSDMNIAFVTHLGDIVEHTDQFEVEWQRASARLAMLDIRRRQERQRARQPRRQTRAATGRSSTSTSRPSRYCRRTLVRRLPRPASPADPVNRQNKNNYELFSVGGLDFMIIHLEYDLPDFALDWADEILNQYPDRQAIIATHVFVNTSNRAATLADRPHRRTSAEAAWQRALRTALQRLPRPQRPLPGRGPPDGHEQLRRPGPPGAVRLPERANGGDGWLRYSRSSRPRTRSTPRPTRRRATGRR